MKKEYQERFEAVSAGHRKVPENLIREGNAFITEGKNGKDMEVVAYGQFMLADGYYRSGRYSEMLKHIMGAVAYFEDSTEYDMLIRAENLLGIVYAALGDHPMALQSYRSAYRIAKEHRRANLYDLLENNIASEYANLSEHNTALRYLEKVYRRMIKKRPENLDEVLLNIVCYNMADSLAKLNRYDEALYYLEACEDILARVDDEVEKSLLGILKCRVYYYAGKNEEGNRAADEVIRYIKEAKDRNYELLEDIERIALYQISIGEYDRADVLADYLWDCSVRTDQSMDIIRACRVQARYFDTIHNAELCLKYYRIMDQEIQRMSVRDRQFQLRLIKERENATRKIEELKNQMKQQSVMSSKDGLTGLLNRSAFSAVMENCIERAKQRAIPLGCIFIDVDHFKEYNDTYGHVKGDECLVKISNVCLDFEKQHSHVHFARYGGDEFFGMFLGYSEQDMVEFAKEISKEIADLNIRHEFEKNIGRVTVSIGVMNKYLNAERDLIDIIKCLDNALYESKAQGRNCIHILSSEHLDPNEVCTFERVE